MPQLVDTTVISNFAAVERLDLLRVALDDAHVTIAVHAEILRGAQDGYEFLDAVDALIASLEPGGRIHLDDLESDEERHHFARLAASVHSGEAASLAIAAHRGWTFVNDDRAARQLAQREGVAVTGTLGILLLLIDQALLNLDEANSLLGLMTARARYRSSVTDLRELLDRWQSLPWRAMMQSQSSSLGSHSLDSRLCSS